MIGEDALLHGGWYEAAHGVWRRFHGPGLIRRLPGTEQFKSGKYRLTVYMLDEESGEELIDFTQEFDTLDEALSYHFTMERLDS